MNKPEQKLTRRQAAVLEFIVDHIGEWGYPPTIREIGDQLDIRSTNGVNDHLKALERKGYLERENSKSRALRPMFFSDGRSCDHASGPNGDRNHDRVHAVPLVGRIAAGNPIAAIENTDEVVHIGSSLLGKGDDIFALSVRGQSMIEDGIFDGDFIFVRKQRDVRDGDIVAAMIDGEATVKRLFREGDFVRLQPANAAMEPIYISAQAARETCVLGSVVGIFRRL